MNRKTAEQKKAEVKNLLNQLEEGIKGLQSSEGWAQWLRFQARLHRYSWSNTLLILGQLPEASTVMGFKAWRDFGRHVRKGEKGLRILAPCFKKVETEGEEKKLAFFKTTVVFDVSQTEGEDLPSPCQKLEEGSTELFGLLEAFATSMGVEVRSEAIPGPANGYYDYVGKFIAVESTNSSAQQTKSMAHEIGHALLHNDLSRDEQNREDRELEAESVAYIVCQHFGLDTSGYSFGYVAQWKGDKAQEGLRKSAKRIADAARRIIEAIETDKEKAA